MSDAQERRSQDVDERLPEAPPVGNEIHLPGPSLQPLFQTIGITMSLVGLTTFPVLLYGGLVLTVWTLVRWTLDTRREVSHLPAHADH